MPLTGRRRDATLLAAGLLLLSLGLPWSGDSQTHVPGWLTPSFCTPGLLDGMISCTPNYFSAGFTTGSPALSGANSPARVFVVGALVLTAVAVWRARPRLLVMAAGTVVVGLLVTGSAAVAGTLAAVAAAALLGCAGRATTSRDTPADATS